MKGDATVHTTNEQYRKGYEAIEWGKKESGDVRVVVPAAAPKTVVDRGRVRD